MESIRQYILSVICIVTVCGIVQMFFLSGTTAALVKLICGLVVTVAVLSPLLQDRILQWDLTFNAISADGELAANAGVTTAKEVQKEIIKEKTQAYILSKAKEMGADITVDVQLQDTIPSVPESVTVSGSCSPYVRSQLGKYMQLELGIAEEDQIWISQD